MARRKLTQKEWDQATLDDTVIPNITQAIYDFEFSDIKYN
jgi:hypothetical protein